MGWINLGSGPDTKDEKWQISLLDTRRATSRVHGSIRTSFEAVETSPWKDIIADNTAKLFSERKLAWLT